MILSHSKGALISMAALWLAISATGVWLGREHRRYLVQASAPTATPLEFTETRNPLGDLLTDSSTLPNTVLERARFLIRSPQVAHRLLEFELAIAELNLSQFKSIATYAQGKLVFADDEDRAMITALLRKMVVMDAETAFVFAEELGAWKNDVLPEVVAAWALADRDAALAWIADAEARLRGRAFRAVLDAVGHTDRRAAIALFKDGLAEGFMPADVWDADDFFRAWIKEDANTAIEEAFALRSVAKKDTAIRNAITAWAQLDSMSALAWLDQKEMSQDLRNRLTIDFVDGLAEKNPEQAADFVLEITDDDTRERAISVALRDWTAISFGAAADWVGKIEDSEVRLHYEEALMEASRWRGNREDAIAYGLEKHPTNWRMYHQIFMQTGSVVREDPAAAVSWIRETFPERLHEELFQQISHNMRRINEAEVHHYLDLIKDPIQRPRHFELAGEHWASVDLDAARNWANALPDSPDRNRALSGVVKVWIDSDPNASANWINDLEAGTLRDELAARYVGKISRSDPAAAVAMAQSIHHPHARDHSMEHALREWMKRDPDAARPVIETSDALSDATRWRLQAGQSSNVRYPIE